MFLGSVAADFRQDIGWTQLKAEYGPSLPDGSGVQLAQIEYIRDGAWAPQPAGELVGKAMSYMPAVVSKYSSHANEVAGYLLGRNKSITPGIATFTAFEANNYVVRSLNTGFITPPLPASWDVESHSWGGSNLQAVQALRRLDFRIARDGVIAVIGVDNGPTMSPMLANSYNSIAVGSSTGKHPRGGSTLEGGGRMKPDLVGTATYTSYATPIVASSASLLVSEIKRSSALAAARHPTVIKALLLTGATKEEFPGWTQSTYRPLDPVYGAGEVNIYNSYKLLRAGRQLPATNRDVALNGWDANTTPSGVRRFYFFTVPAGKTLKWSAVLSWHRVVTPNLNWLLVDTSVPNLDLILWKADGSFIPRSEVARSASVNDNVEHIYRTHLPAGRYALEVVAPAANIAYGLAWQAR